MTAPRARHATHHPPALHPDPGPTGGRTPIRHPLPLRNPANGQRSAAPLAGV